MNTFQVNMRLCICYESSCSYSFIELQTRVDNDQANAELSLMLSSSLLFLACLIGVTVLYSSGQYTLMTLLTSVSFKNFKHPALLLWCSADTLPDYGAKM